MSTNKVKVNIANPNNEKHLEMYKNFDSLYGTSTLKLLKKSLVKEPYEIKENIFLEEENKIIDCCYVEGNKDLKSVSLLFPNIETKKERKIIKVAEDYAFNSCNAENVFVTTSNKAIIKKLKENNYEVIDSETNEVILEKDRELEHDNLRGSYNGRI